MPNSCGNLQNCHLVYLFKSCADPNISWHKKKINGAVAGEILQNSSNRLKCALMASNQSSDYYFVCVFVFLFFLGSVTAVSVAGAIGIGAGIWYLRKMRAKAPVTHGVQSNENRLF